MFFKPNILRKEVNGSFLKSVFKQWEIEIKVFTGKDETIELRRVIELDFLF